MLEAVDVLPGDGESGMVAREQIQSDVKRIHPVGKTFVAFEPTGSFKILRGPGRMTEGVWMNDLQGGFSLELKGIREDGPAGLPYRLFLLEEERLILEFRVNPEAGVTTRPFLLHFIPSKWDMELLAGGDS